MQKPNIIVLCSDQHHPRVSGYRGHPYVQTPNLDRLAAEGACFTRAYCNSPLCTPSRMSFLTGKYTHEINSWVIGCPLDRKEMTWGKRLDQAGIPSTYLGKLHFCGPYVDGGFTQHRFSREYPNTVSGALNIPLAIPYAPRLEGHIRLDKQQLLASAGPFDEPLPDGIMNNPPLREQQHFLQYGYYGHDREVTDWTKAYLQQKGAEKTGEPWALFVGFLMPHWPFRVPEKYFKMYYPDQVKWPVDARFPNPDLHPALQHFQRSTAAAEAADEAVRRTIAAYYAMITALDDMIGEILAELDIQGLAENTYVIYTSDHGESLGEHGLFYKECSYEGSVGVPLIVRGPGLPQGKEIRHPVSLIDLYPTILDMAGIEQTPEANENRPGASWLPLILDQAHHRLDYAFSEFHGNLLKHDWYMLVQGDYKYTHYVPDRPTLFNVKEDPEERNDLAVHPAYAQKLAEFERLLRTIVDPERVALRAKSDLGLIGPNGEDYTLSLTVKQRSEAIRQGKFPAHK